MQVASVLSDLTSLRVCVSFILCRFVSGHRITEYQDHAAALALVSVHKDAHQGPTANMGASEDVDMKRATDLLDLHYGVKLGNEQGTSEVLRKARKEVQEVTKEMDERKSRAKTSHT